MVLPTRESRKRPPYRGVLRNQDSSFFVRGRFQRCSDVGRHLTEGGLLFFCKRTHRPPPVFSPKGYQPFGCEDPAGEGERQPRNARKSTELNYPLWEVGLESPNLTNADEYSFVRTTDRKGILNEFENEGKRVFKKLNATSRAIEFSNSHQFNTDIYILHCAQKKIL